MSTLRKHVKSGFTQIPNETVRDNTLSFKATGILAVLLSHSDGWNVTIKGLAGGKTDGVAGVRTGCTELAEAGYILRVQQHDEAGQITTVTHVSDTPVPEWIKATREGTSPEFENPNSVEPHSAKPNSVNHDALEEKGLEEQSTEEHREELLSGKPDDCSISVVPIDDRTQEAIEKATTKEANFASVANNIFQVWVEVMGKNNGAILNEKRKAAIRARLNEGYSESLLVAAVRGLANSPWHMGQNPDRKLYNDLEFALRNGVNVERFAAMADGPSVAPGRTWSSTDQAVERLRAGGM